MVTSNPEITINMSWTLTQYETQIIKKISPHEDFDPIYDPIKNAVNKCWFATNGYKRKHFALSTCPRLSLRAHYGKQSTC